MQMDDEFIQDFTLCLEVLVPSVQMRLQKTPLDHIVIALIAVKSHLTP